MNCPHCLSTKISRLAEKTSLGYRTFRCSQCGGKFNQRTETPFNHLQFPTDIVLLVVLWRLRCKLSLRDLSGLYTESCVIWGAWLSFR
jgi:putative transposase